MSTTSTLTCDDCGLTIVEGGRQPVEPPEGWVSLWEEDYCPSCSEVRQAMREQAAQPAPGAEEGE